jgi:hypothetical protein
VGAIRRRDSVVFAAAFTAPGRYIYFSREGIVMRRCLVLVLVLAACQTAEPLAEDESSSNDVVMPDADVRGPVRWS